VQGRRLTGLSVKTLNRPTFQWIDSTHGRIGSGELLLALTGKVDGTDSILTMQNTGPWTAGVTSQVLTLSGPVDFTVSTPQGASVPITANISATASPSTPAQQACTTLTPIQRLFGFEERASWSSSNAVLSYSATPLSQGCGALGVTGQGYMTISSAAFPTAVLAVANAISVDVFVPSSQPNPYWQGTLDAFLSCPSGNVFNQYVGQVALTGLPQNAYSTARFLLPSALVTALRKDLRDCSWTFALNVNQTMRTWLLDNLRFAP